MEQQFLSIEQFNKLIKEWNGQNIKISKQEMGDHDELLMRLQTISYKKNTRRMDDYVPKNALQLNGLGNVQTENNDYADLPTSMYEIPLEDHTHYQFDGSRFSLTTDRGTYTIEIAPKGKGEN